MATFNWDESPSVNVRNVKVMNARLVYSVYIPLGENAIIQLVEKFRTSQEIEVINTDLYYFIEILYEGCKINFYSRGLVTLEDELNEIVLNRIIDNAYNKKNHLLSIIQKLLSRYHLSLIELLGNVDDLPIHISIVVDDFDEPGYAYVNALRDISESDLDSYKDQRLKSLTKLNKIQEYLGEPRSIDSRPHEDVIIGTKGSIIRSDEIDVLLSYHTYNRALHLFLAKYNIIVESVWNKLNENNRILNEFTLSFENEKTTNFSRVMKIFSSGHRKRLGSIKSSIIDSVKNVDHFLVLAKFIEDSIEFTSAKYQKSRDEKKLLENSFDIRKVLKTLRDRSRHLKIVSESLMIKSRSLITRLDLYDSEIAYENKQRIETLAFATGSLGIIIASIAIFLSIG